LITQADYADNEYGMIDKGGCPCTSIQRGCEGGMHLQKPLVAAVVGLSTKIHAVVEVLGNPLSFHLTPGQACDLEGADQLLPNIVADTVLADKGYDADERVIDSVCLLDPVTPKALPCLVFAIYVKPPSLFVGSN